MSTFNDSPDLRAVRQFTRDVGPAAMLAGALIAVHGAVLHIIDSAFALWLVLPCGLLLVLFGGAAFARTESTFGSLLRWMVVLTFAGGGVFALLQWSQLIWGSRGANLTGDVTIMGLYLMAGPALLVPAGLAVARSAWVPLIVTPAIAAIASASALGYGTLLIQQISTGDAGLSPLPDLLLMGGVVLASAALVLYSGQRGLTATRQRAEEKRL